MIGDNDNEMTTAVETTNGLVVVQATYTYDVLGNRIQTNVTQNGQNTVTRSGYDGWNPAETGGEGDEDWQVWATVDSSGALTMRVPSRHSLELRDFFEYFGTATLVTALFDARGHGPRSQVGLMGGLPNAA